MEPSTIDKAQEFIEANRASPIVYGSVRSTGGAYYTLDNGRSFVLSRDDCERISFRVGMPRWKLP